MSKAKQLNSTAKRDLFSIPQDSIFKDQSYLDKLQSSINKDTDAGQFNLASRGRKESLPDKELASTTIQPPTASGEMEDNLMTILPNSARMSHFNGNLPSLSGRGNGSFAFPASTIFEALQNAGQTDKFQDAGVISNKTRNNMTAGYFSARISEMGDTVGEVQRGVEEMDVSHFNETNKFSYLGK